MSLLETRFAAARPRPSSTLSVSRVFGRRFAPGSERMDDPASSDFFRAAAPAQSVAIEDLTRRGNSYASMSHAVTADIIEASPIDLLVLAHSAPDFIPNDIASLVVASRPGVDVTSAFAVCDAGRLSAFAALDVAERHARRRAFDRVLVVVVDHGTFPYRVDAHPSQLIDGDAAVAILLERGESSDFAVCRRPVPSENGLADAVATVVRNASTAVIGDGQTVTRVVVGAGIALSGVPWRPLLGETMEIHVLEAGAPVTGAWFAVGGEESGSTVLVDYDRSVGAVAACAFKDPSDVRYG